MTARNVWATVGVALLLVLAGCSSGVEPGTDDTGDTGETGTVNIYVSDQQNAIDQFEHLNATVTEVTFVKANGEGDSGNESESRVTVNIDNVTVDLTKLQGAKSALIGQSAVPSGNYSKVFLSVGSIDGTLTDGSSADVKLPSNRLQLTKPFTLSANSSVEFVFDITVVKAGNSGKYILKPVVGQSGTSDEVEIDKQDDEESENKSDANEADADDETETAALNATFVGNITTGANATVSVTQNGSAVANATVSVAQEIDSNETTVELTTDANGTVSFAVDQNATAVEVTVTTADGEAELEREFETAESGEEDGSAGDDSGNNSLVGLAD